MLFYITGELTGKEWPPDSLTHTVTTRAWSHHNSCVVGVDVKWWNHFTKELGDFSEK